MGVFVAIATNFEAACEAMDFTQIQPFPTFILLNNKKYGL